MKPKAVRLVRFGYYWMSVKLSCQVIFLKNGQQKNLHNTISVNSEKQELNTENFLIVEFESSWSQKELGELFEKSGMISLQFNGGTYIVTFPENVTIYDFMNIISNNQVPILYFRNISNSTRRFFVS